MRKTSSVQAGTRAIEFEGVHLRAPGVKTDQWRRILGPLSLRLSERRIAIIGANGSGKSSFLRLINGLLTPTAGRVLVHHLDPASDGSQVRKKVGFLFSDPTAALIMPTPLEDVCLSLRSRYRKAQERRRRAVQLLERFHLGHCADQSIYTLSGGERQLIALMSILALEPDILVFDEPTTLLDLAHTLHLRQLCMSLPQQLVVATHDLEWAATFERTLVMAQGVLVCDAAGPEAVDYYRTMVCQGALSGGRAFAPVVPNNSRASR